MKRRGIVKIEFDEDCEWDFKIITFQSVRSLVL